MVKLLIEAIFKFSLGALLTGILLFVSAGTIAFFNGWLFMAALFVPMFLAGIVMAFKNPSLLKSRLDAKEMQNEQGLVVKLSGVMFLIGFIVAGLGKRFGWYSFSLKIVYVGLAIFLTAYLLYAEVLRENSYLSRTIKVQESQYVIDTGLYGIVRHPMYSATLVLFLSMPIVLGSIYSLLVFLIYPFILVRRILLEEALLKKELPGYVEYMQKVRYRLIPFVW